MNISLSINGLRMHAILIDSIRLIVISIDSLNYSMETVTKP